VNKDKENAGFSLDLLHSAEDRNIGIFVCGPIHSDAGWRSTLAWLP